MTVPQLLDHAREIARVPEGLGWDNPLLRRMIKRARDYINGYSNPDTDETADPWREPTIVLESLDGLHRTTKIVQGATQVTMPISGHGERVYEMDRVGLFGVVVFREIDPTAGESCYVPAGTEAVTT